MEAQVYRYAELASTNDEAMRLALAGAEPFTTIVADTQTAGRGRNGRVWQSPPGVGLYASIVLRPSMPLEQIPVVTLATGLAAAEAVRSQTGLDALLKWPNDILVNYRKVAGILCEASMTAGKTPVVIAGLGVNVNTPPHDLPERPLYPASSLAAESGLCHDRDSLLAGWMARMRHWIGALEQGCANAMLEAWNALDALKGMHATVAHPDGTSVNGVECGVDADGRLRLRLDDGTMQPVIAGDVSIAAK